MRVVWEYEIGQTFEGGITHFFTERFPGNGDLFCDLVDRRQKWLSQVYLKEDKSELPCISVKVLSAKKICDLTK